MRGMTAWRAGAVAVLALLGIARACAADAPPHAVKDPHYGDSLFYFFQERYFTSVTDLMVSQYFGRVPHHADEAEVMRGGMLLSYGLHRQAGKIFETLIERGAAPPVRDRAWFYLAKIRYQRGLPAEAESAISHVGSQLPADLEEERGLLLANLRMARADYAGAASVLDAMASRPTASQYVRFNLGIALIKSGQWERGKALLDEVGQAPAEGEEMRSLRDKANVALGFSALQGNDPELARHYLERVRLTGMLANKALLGFGWASAALKRPKDALVPWMELARRDTTDAAVLEAKLAVPYAFGELGAYAQSLEQYNDAIAVYEAEDTKLDQSIAAIRSGRLVDGLLARNPGEEMGWLGSIDRLPEIPHATFLAPLLAQNRFQEAFKNLRDLQFLAQNLRAWDEKLGVIGDMLANRRQAFADRLPEVRVRERAIHIGQYEQRREALAGELARADAQADGLAFADAGEHALIDRLYRVRAALERMPEGAEKSQARERYRRALGALTWRLADESAGRLWEAKKSIGALDQEVAEARRRYTELAQARLTEPARFERFAERIVELTRRLHALTPRVAALLEAQRDYVQELAVAELQHEKERLAAYTTQARFAVAQIYDRANSAKDGTHAPGP